MELQKFERYEFKYILEKDLRIIIERDVKNFMKLDAYAKQNQSYFVRSLYFDDPSFVNYFEKIDDFYKEFYEILNKDLELFFTKNNETILHKKYYCKISFIFSILNRAFICNKYTPLL